MVRHDMTQSLVVDDFKNSGLIASNIKKLIGHEEKIEKLNANILKIYNTYFQKYGSENYSKILNKSQISLDPNMYKYIYSDGEYIYFIDSTDNLIDNKTRKDDAHRNSTNYPKLSNHATLLNREKEKKCNLNKNEIRSDYIKNMDFTNKFHSDYIRTHYPKKHNSNSGKTSTSNIGYYKSEYDFNLDHVNLNCADTQINASLNSQHNEGNNKSDELKSPHSDPSNSKSISKTRPKSEMRNTSTQTNQKDSSRSKSIKGSHLKISDLMTSRKHKTISSVSTAPDTISPCNKTKIIRSFDGDTCATRFNDFDNKDEDYFSEDQSSSVCIALADYSDYE